VLLGPHFAFRVVIQVFTELVVGEVTQFLIYLGVVVLNISS
jgi:hypothetical protein